MSITREELNGFAESIVSKTTKADDTSKSYDEIGLVSDALIAIFDKMDIAVDEINNKCKCKTCKCGKNG